MRLLICGPRDASPSVRRSVIEFVRGLSRLGPDVVVVTGGARGVDTVAANFAAEVGLSVEVVKPDYELLPGKVAPLVRDRDMVDSVDGVVAFCERLTVDGSAPRLDGGTGYTATYARRRHVPTYIRLGCEVGMPWSWLELVSDRVAARAHVEVVSQASLF